MYLETEKMNTKFTESLQRLIKLSNEDKYDPFKELEWPEAIEEDQYWMSPQLMSVYGTPYMEELDRRQLIKLSKWECINFFSLNVTGIRKLLVDVLQRIHNPGFELASEYLHYIIAEENEHMWFFARFCLNYGGKIYKDRRFQMNEIPEPDIQDFMAFMTVLLFEEIVDFYNAYMAKDEVLHPKIREINRLHHLDEGRHINFGWQHVELLHRKLRERYDEKRIDEIETILRSYILSSIQQLYNPDMYRDADFSKPVKIRKELLASPYRKEFHNKIFAKSFKLLFQKGIFKQNHPVEV